MTADDAAALRKRLEMDILALLQAYRNDTGLTPHCVDVQTVGRVICGGDRRSLITGVRVEVEL